MCFVDLEKAFDRVPRMVLEWAMKKRGIPEVMVRAVMSLYGGEKTRVRVGQELSEEFEAKVGDSAPGIRVVAVAFCDHLRDVKILATFPWLKVREIIRIFATMQ